jgi:hypothetical protein
MMRRRLSFVPFFVIPIVVVSVLVWIVILLRKRCKLCFNKPNNPIDVVVDNNTTDDNAHDTKY